MKADELPAAQYTVPEIEAYLDLPEKIGYRLIREGKLEGQRDVTGKMRVSYGALYSYMKQLQEATK